MKLAEMRQLLATRGIQLTRSLGQNFLHDANQLRKIVDLAQLQATDRVLEVGPGLGPLTELLLKEAGEVLAIEKDARLVAVLRERFAAHPRLRLVQADALVHLERNEADWHDWKVVSNLPYSVASPILVELAEATRCPERLVATLQQEVIRRLMSGPGTKDYGVLTLLVQLRYEPRGSFRIPATCFFPAPEVDSGCVFLQRRAEEFLSAAARRVFKRVVKRAFSERRKKAVKLLRFDWPADVLAEAWRQLALPELVRAEQISLAQFVSLARTLTALPPAPSPAPL